MKLLTTLSRIAILELCLIVSFITAGSFTQKPQASSISSATPQSPKPTRTNSVSPSLETQKSLPPEASVSDRCIITIDNAQYDITDFRSVHSGGDIFTCNTDMSSIFWQQHDQAHLNQLVMYRMQ